MMSEAAFRVFEDVHAHFIFFFVQLELQRPQSPQNNVCCGMTITFISLSFI